MKEDQKNTPKYWVAHDPRNEGVYLQTADKSHSGCEDKAIHIFKNKGEFYNAIDDGHLEITLMEIKPTTPFAKKVKSISPYSMIVSRPWVRLEATQDYRMNDTEEIAFKKGRAYLFAHSGEDAYTTVSEGGNEEHIMFLHELKRFFKPL